MFAAFALLCVVASVPLVLITRVTGRRTRARWMANNLAVVVAGALLVILVHQKMGRGLAARNERLIIPAVDRFRADYGRYPDSLQELVPRHLSSTLPAGSPLPGYGIRYSRERDRDDAVLFVDVSPLGATRTWRFKEHRAGYLD